MFSIIYPSVKKRVFQSEQRSNIYLSYTYNDVKHYEDHKKSDF